MPSDGQNNASQEIKQAEIETLSIPDSLQKKLSESDSFFAAAFYNAPIGKSVTSPEGKWLAVNQAFCDITGYTQTEMQRMGFSNITYPEDLAQDFFYLDKMLSGELSRCRFQKQYIHKQGHLIRVQMDISVVRDTLGTPLCFISQVEDITERHRIEEALRESEERFRSAFSYAPIGIAIVSTEGHWLKVNDAVCQITGYSDEEMLRTDFQSITHPDDLHLDLQYLPLMVDGTLETCQIEKRYIHKQGHEVWVQLNASAVRSSDGAVQYFISQIQDISNRRLAEEQLKAAKEAAEKASIAKADFLAIMSHEIRTPLNAVAGMSALLESTPLNENQKDLVKTIRNSSDALLGIINDILDFSKIESGKMELNMQPFDLKHCIESVWSLFTRKAEDKSLSFSYALDPHIPQHILGDSVRLRQILMNLIENSLKFTENGFVHLNVYLKRDSETSESNISNGSDSAQSLELEPDHREVHFEIRDSGCGIPADKLQSIFEAFTQVTPSISHDYGGTGLGLAICNRLVQLMGGSLSVESTLGEGTKFHFMIQTLLAGPVWEELQLQTTSEKAISLPEGLKILVVEDNPTNRKLMKHLLERLGYTPMMATNGQEALDMIEHVQFDIIFMDIQMPVLDGLEATRRLISRYPDNRPRVVAMTAFGFSEDRQKCLAAGMDGYLSKPVSIQTIREMLMSAPFDNLVNTAQEQLGTQVDSETLLARVGNDRSALRALIRSFGQDCPEILNKINEALAQKDIPTLKHLAHELKGVASTMSAPGLQQLAHQMEKKAALVMADADYEQLAEILNSLQAEFQAVEAILKSQGQQQEEQ